MTNQIRSEELRTSNSEPMKDKLEEERSKKLTEYEEYYRKQWYQWCAHNTDHELEGLSFERYLIWRLQNWKSRADEQYKQLQRIKALTQDIR